MYDGTLLSIDGIEYKLGSLYGSYYITKHEYVTAKLLDEEKKLLINKMAHELAEDMIKQELLTISEINLFDAELIRLQVELKYLKRVDK